MPQVLFRRSPDTPLAYLEQGMGPVVVLVHGSLTDARYWLRSGQLTRLAANYRVLAPSRRHSHPHLPREEAGYNVLDDAADLIAFIRDLAPEPVHLVGHSYGAYAALVATLEAPELVCSLVLAEPPIMRWLPWLPGGQGIWEGFEERVWRPLGRAFMEGGEEAGLEATARWAFGKPFSQLESESRQDLLDSVREWRALTTGADAFPLVPLAAVAEIAVPTLVLSAGKSSGGFNDLIDVALVATIPKARRIVVPDASHEMFLDAPAFVASELMRFMEEVPI